LRAISIPFFADRNKCS